MKVWFDDPQQLIRADKVSQFWPINEQTPEDRINAASRFIIYASCLIYLIRRDPRIFVLGATVLSVIFVLYRSNMVKDTIGYTVDGESVIVEPGTLLWLMVNPCARCPPRTTPWVMCSSQISQMPLIGYKRVIIPV